MRILKLACTVAAAIAVALAHSGCGRTEEERARKPGHAQTAEVASAEAPAEAGGEAAVTAGGEAATGEAAGAEDAAAEAAPPVPGKERAPAPPAALTARDVEAYRRGQSGEIAHVEKLLGELAAAEDAAARAPLIARLEDRRALLQAGARAAEVDTARYRAISTAVEEVLGRWRRVTVLSRLAADTTRIATMPPDMQARFRAQIASLENAYDGLPAGTVAAVLPHAGALDSLHAITGALVQSPAAASRNKGASGGR